MTTLHETRTPNSQLPFSIPIYHDDKLPVLSHSNDHNALQFYSYKTFNWKQQFIIWIIVGNRFPSIASLMCFQNVTVPHTHGDVVDSHSHSRRTPKIVDSKTHLLYFILLVKVIMSDQIWKCGMEIAYLLYISTTHNYTQVQHTILICLLFMIMSLCCFNVYMFLLVI